MDFEISSENKLIADTVRRFVKERLGPLEAGIDAADEIDPAMLRALKQEVIALGLFGYNMPAVLGGPELSVAAQSVIDEELGRTTMPLAEAFGHLPGSLRLVNQAQREWLIQPLMRAEATIAYALTEPGAGSDLSAIATRAEKVSGGWRLNGTKHFISAAEHADFLLVLAVTAPQEPLKTKLTTFIIERGNPGWKNLRRFRKMGWHGHPR
jgi:alkylation response protein AidB-like acyl-CoA dehydrogenase